MLTVNHLNVEIDNKTLLNDISFEVNEGEIIGVLGVNGAGKTTLFNSLFFENKQHKSLKINNNVVSQQEISYIESENNFYPYLTVEEFIDLVNFNDNDYKNILIEVLKLPIHTYVHRLSTGEKKKLAIISNLLSDKKLFLFDEPFNGLDFESYETVQKLLVSSIFRKKYILISSHILESLTKICDKIMLIENGKIIKRFDASNYCEITHCYTHQIQSNVDEIESCYNKGVSIVNRKFHL